MGGFVITNVNGEMPDSLLNKLGDICKKNCVRAVSASGFQELLKAGVIQDLVRDGKLRRKAAGLPVTLLEVRVLIQVVYTLVTYIFWWHKPLDVAEPIAIPLLKDHEIKLLKSCENFFSDVENSNRREDGKSLYVKHRTVLDGVLSPLAMASYDLFWTLDNTGRTLVMITAVINGGLHCVTWFSYFPSPPEMWLWRASAVGIALSNIVITLVLMGPWGRDCETYILLLAWRVARIPKRSALRARRESLALVRPESGHPQVPPNPFVESPPREEKEDENSWRDAPCVVYSGWWRGIGWGGFMLVFLFFNFFLTVKAFVSVRSLPVGAYATVPWSAFSPHV
ncbi:hypothetical protein B0H67DRAFT_558364 [Lasiosphaeris hirsuta]|uniref:Uncharacterized protein n=1 Tax=Lasiosphaeris hirsuta TaxID=260670 RepID=A0AA39ZS97_9PEZI|nr:hypothetical protein B0H67DRAFT_558364 [Lasiosphaeris hirsuta]